MKIFFDTNLLAYQFDDDQPFKQRRARELFLDHATEAVISTQVMIELYAVLTRKLGRSREDALAALHALDLDVVAADRELVLAAGEAAVRYQLSLFDALILEAAAQSSCEELWTEDLATGTRLRGVLVVNPFTR